MGFKPGNTVLNTFIGVLQPDVGHEQLFTIQTLLRNSLVFLIGSAPPHCCVSCLIFTSWWCWKSCDNQWRRANWEESAACHTLFYHIFTITHPPTLNSFHGCWMQNSKLNVTQARRASWQHWSPTMFIGNIWSRKCPGSHVCGISSLELALHTAQQVWRLGFVTNPLVCVCTEGYTFQQKKKMLVGITGLKNQIRLINRGTNRACAWRLKSVLTWNQISPQLWNR